MPDFHQVPKALKPPNLCVGCNTHARREGFVDLHREIPGYGNVYLCHSCVISAGKHAGLVDDSVHAQLQDGYAKVLTTVDQLEARLDDLQQVQRAVQRLAGQNVALPVVKKAS